MNKIPDNEFPLFHLTKSEADFLRNYANQRNEYFLCFYCKDFDRPYLQSKIQNSIKPCVTLSSFFITVSKISKDVVYPINFFELRIQWINCLLKHNNFEPINYG